MDLNPLKNALDGVAKKQKPEGTQKEFDCHTINQIIAGHFYRQGLDIVGDCFVNEADESESTAVLRSIFCELYVIVGAIKERNLEPALTWAAANSKKLKEHGSDLELKLLRLQYMEILQKGYTKDAVAYVKSHLTSFGVNNVNEIQKLLSCLLWVENLDRSPYSDLLSPTYWNIVAEELAIQFSYILGQSFESPLSLMSHIRRQEVGTDGE